MKGYEIIKRKIIPKIIQKITTKKMTVESKI
jgi:hypothetical protein